MHKDNHPALVNRVSALIKKQISSEQLTQPGGIIALDLHRKPLMNTVLPFPPKHYFLPFLLKPTLVGSVVAELLP